MKLVSLDMAFPPAHSAQPLALRASRLRLMRLLDFALDFRIGARLRQRFWFRLRLLQLMYFCLREARQTSVRLVQTCSKSPVAPARLSGRKGQPDEDAFLSPENQLSSDGDLLLTF